MRPGKFENKVKKLLGEREIKPSAQSWERLEQRLEKKGEKRRPFLLWITSAAAIAAIFFVLGTYFNPSIPLEEPQMVEQEPEQPVLEEKISEPEIIQIAASEEEEDLEEEQKSSAEKPVKNTIFGAPVEKTSEKEMLLASEMPSEAPEEVKPEREVRLAGNKLKINTHKNPSVVTDNEVEALLLLATAELKSDPTFTVNSKDLLNQVEYELEQSFRQKVFEVVKEGLSKAKTAVANRDF